SLSALSLFFFSSHSAQQALHSFPTRRSSDLKAFLHLATNADEAFRKEAREHSQAALSRAQRALLHEPDYLQLKRLADAMANLATHRSGLDSAQGRRASALRFK